MKRFFIGLTAGLAAGVVAQMMIAKNHEQMLELVQSIPKPLKFGPAASLDELLAQKERLEDLIVQKQQEAEAFEASEPEEAAEETAEAEAEDSKEA